MIPETEESHIAGIALRYGVSEDAVRIALTAIRRGGGQMAQFSHPDFGGMAQWTPTMSMVGDMFNSGLKAKLDGVCADLAAYIRSAPGRLEDAEGTSYRSASSMHSIAWPKALGRAVSTGSQNAMHYAIFPAARRLAISDNGRVRIFDTGDHVIQGISQAQSQDQTLTFSSQHGLVRLTELREVRE